MDIPAVENENIGLNLLALKKGSKKRATKNIQRLSRKAKPIKIKSDVDNEKDGRRILYNASKYRMNLWKNPVHKQRLADQIIFPIQSNAIEQYNSETANQIKLTQSIEHHVKNAPKAVQDLYKSILKKKDIHTSDTQILLTSSQQKDLAITLAKKADVANRDRLRNEYIHRKFARQKRIKSKSFHKHMKRRELKEFEKQTELLRTSDPKAFSERLLEAERQRIQERITQKHKSGSKFARMQKIRMRYDKDARDAVSSMYEQHKDLVNKTFADQESDVSDIDLSSTDDDVESSNEDSDDLDDEDFEQSQKLKSLEWWKQAESINETKIQEKPLSNPGIESVLISSKTDKIDDDDDGPIIGASIADKVAELCSVGQDDLIEMEFTEEKTNIADEEAPKDIDTYMPGWNSWTGPGTEDKDEALKIKRLVKAPERNRIDAKSRKAIIRERVNEEMKKHLIKSIPFPYNTPEQYESTLKQPIGREWNTENSHRKMIKPRIVVQKGKIIRPLDSNAAFLREKDVERLAKNSNE